MTLEKSLSVSFTGAEANALFYEPIYQDKDLVSSFRVIPNVTSKKKLAFAQEMEKIVKRYNGCGFQPKGAMKLYDRMIEVDHAEFAVEQCWEEFKDTVYEEALNRGVRLPDINGTIIMQILTDMVTNAVKKDNLRLAFFGNRASSSSAYDVTDGLWSVLIPAFITASQVNSVNAGSGTALGAGDGIDLLRAVYAKQHVNLRGLPSRMKKFYVSGDVFDAFRTDIEDGGGGDAGITLLQDGTEELRFRGIEVVSMWTWNDILVNDFSLTEPHRVLLTTPQNLALGTDLVGQENSYKVWYNEEDEAVRMKGRWKMGFQIIHPTLLVAGL